jgi:alkaline phosphatase D
MGRPFSIKPRPTGSTRRGFLFKSAGSAAALAAAPLAPAGAQSANGPRFQHGVASGDPLADRVVLWTRVSPVGRPSVVNVGYVVALDPALQQVVQRGSAKTNPDRDYTVKVDPTGLQPATTYYYRFTANGQDSPVGRTRTLPVGATTRLRIAVASCSNHAYGHFNAYRRIAERADLDLVLHLGDYLYEYGPNEYGSVRQPEPPNEIVTLSDYRTRHAQYKRDADLQEVHRQHPVVAIWDDHEVTNDAWRDGAQNHTEGAEGAWPERVNQALQAYYEWMPVRIPDPAQRRQEQRAFGLGDLVELVMLEERLQARSQQLPGTIPIPSFNTTGFVQAGPFADPSRTLLGAEQEAWLAQRLRGTPARWKFIGQGVMFAPLKLVAAPLSAGGGVFFNADQWDGYQPARDRLFSVFKGDGQQQPPVGNCVILTGDIHSSWAADLNQDPNNPVVATGGYDAASGEGSKAVEFVGTSITSPGVPDPNGQVAATLRSINPHFKYIDLNRRGYMLLDVTHDRVVCEWWYVDTVASASNVQAFGAAFEVQSGSNRLRPSAQTSPKPNPPALAP